MATSSAAAVRPDALPGPTAARPGPFARRRRRLYWPFVIPVLALYLAFLVGPSIASLWISFHSWQGAGDPLTWVGTRNYSNLLHDEAYRIAFTNTLKLLLLAGAATFVIAFFFTMVLRELRGARTVRAVLFFPNIVAPVALGIVWGVIFRSDGLLNSGLQTVRADSVAQSWLGPDWVFTTIMLAIVWANVGLYTTILMAAVDRIPAYYYEDSSLAGASALQRFRYVTLPMTWDVAAVAAVLWVISAIKVFEFIYVLAGTGSRPPSLHSWTLAVYVYDSSIGSQTEFVMGRASAIAVTMVFLVGILVVLIRRLMRREAIQF